MFALLSSVILLSLGLVAPGFRTDIKISENGFAYEINNVLRHKNISEMDYSPARSLIFILLPSLSDKIKRAAPIYFTDPIYKGSFSMLSAILLLLNGSKGEMCIGYMLVLFLVLFPILKFQTLFNMLIFERANRYEKIIISISRFSTRPYKDYICFRPSSYSFRTSRTEGLFPIYDRRIAVQMRMCVMRK